ncbi:hypothetical protein ASG43_01140 [Aureimonas sp. Leaf454]|uniref:DUF2336 domain-containing protein n=1 Tax=Aureimonas sp. Leaf454 TaxID=1736381 RepID=UPI0006FBEBA4|nr:DUF2336 domain-containing protein [Aureimonas sp. Leaf454]KQT54258.1 hypothetical protein ASG43_01140 [Aureimonas sp. Leaf454]
MKDANPRIFRSLETAAGSAEFDTIVAAAVSSYGALRRPSELQARDFARLVLPVWDRLRPESKRALGASLSHSENVPRGIVQKLLDEPIEIAAPFLVSSPVLTDADRLKIARDRDLRLPRAQGPGLPRIEMDAPAADDRTSGGEREGGRTAGNETTGFTSAAVAAPQADRAEIRATASAMERPQAWEQRPSAEHKEPGQAAAAVREALRRLVQPGRRSAARRMTLTDLVELSVRGDRLETMSVLADMAGIDERAAERIAEDETGERLAVALKAIGASDADAMTILMMLKPKIGLDVAVFDIMARYYKALKRDDCVLIVGGRRRVEAPALEPLFEDIERPERAAQPRAAFGRRTERPAASQPKSRNG